MQVISYSDPENPAVKYAVPKGLSTSKTMAYQYGYLEMRAKMTYQQGVWHAFWLQGLTDVAQSYDDYEMLLNGCLPEVDIFEVHNNATQCVTPNLHLWKWDNTEQTTIHAQAPKYTGERQYTFADTANLSEEYHTYGFLWTPDEMTMYIDNVPYITYKLNEKLWDDLDSRLTERAFHSPMDIIIGTGISTEENAGWDSSLWLEDDKFNGVNFFVDYIRLYQNNTIEGTKFLTKK